MILSAFTRWTNRARLAKARREFGAARAEWNAAHDRQDTRRMSAAAKILRTANWSLIKAEREAGIC